MPGREFDMHLAQATFAPYLEANVRTKLPTFHVSLNPSPEDRQSDGQLREIAREYMERMGYGSQPLFVFKIKTLPGRMYRLYFKRFCGRRFNMNPVRFVRLMDANC